MAWLPLVAEVFWMWIIEISPKILATFPGTTALSSSISSWPNTSTLMGKSSMRELVRDAVTTTSSMTSCEGDISTRKGCWASARGNSISNSLFSYPTKEAEKVCFPEGIFFNSATPLRSAAAPIFTFAFKRTVAPMSVSWVLMSWILIFRDEVWLKIKVLEIKEKRATKIDFFMAWWLILGKDITGFCIKIEEMIIELKNGIIYYLS